jgi:lipopolysaccharide export LptBFGC system permease protein LptF
MNWRVRYVPDEILAICITAVIWLTAIFTIINISRLIEWVGRLPGLD